MATLQWAPLNETLLKATEEECRELLRGELRSKCRRSHLFRIHMRLDKLRRHRERQELAGKAKAR